MGSTMIFAQSVMTKSQNRHLIKRSLNIPPVVELETNQSAETPDNQPEQLVSNRFETIVGSTRFDVQTYGTMPSRIVNYGDNLVSLIWLTGLDDAGGFGDRGTGYNHYDGSSWGPVSGDRIEPDIRSGFPAFTVTGSGNEIVCNHKTPVPYEHRTYTKAAGSTDFVEATVPNNVPGGMLWPRIAASGDNVHVIGVTTPVEFGGSVYEGADTHLLYYRSQDGGATWDIQDMVIPGLDTVSWTTFPAESYSIDAKDDVVAVLMNDQWGDVALFKSVDNGTTWEKTIINDFPLDKYVDDSGYTFADIGGFDTNGPGAFVESPTLTDSLAIRTTDGTGNLIIDENDKVHVCFGEMYVTDDFAGAGTFFYPSWSGLLYWNEDIPTDSLRYIADLVDYGEDEVFDFAGDIAFYGSSQTSHPSFGIDVAGNLFISYSGVAEGFIYEDDDQNFRHIYLLSSEDNGENWSAPTDITSPTYIEEFYELMETVFPSIARHVDDKVHLVFERDFRPGLGVWGDEDPSTFNDICYIAVGKEDLVTVSTENIISADKIEFTLSPNPAKAFTSINYTLDKQEEVTIEVFNIAGQRINTIFKAKQLVGTQSHMLNLENYATGVYFVNITLGDKIATQKLVVK